MVFGFPSFHPPSRRYLVLATPTVFLPIPLKLYRYLEHVLKIYILFGYCLSLFSQFELSHFYGQSEWIQGILCWQLPLQCFADSFETLRMFRSWSEDAHIVWM